MLKNIRISIDIIGIIVRMSLLIDSMKTILRNASVAAEEEGTAPAQPLMHKLMAPLDRLSAKSTSLIVNYKASFETNGQTYILPRFLYLGPRGGDESTRIGLFAGLRGNEPEGTHALVRFLEILEENPASATGYCLFIYPICNPVEFESPTGESSSGEVTPGFWKSSAQPWVRLLQSDIASHALHGGVILRSDESLSAFHGVANGATLTQHLIKPAMAAAGKYLPVDQRDLIDGKRSFDGAIWGGGRGQVSAPPAVRPQPFEISLCAPRSAPEYLKEFAWLGALQTILSAYREFMAFARNI